MAKIDTIRLNQAHNKIIGWLDESKIKWEEIPAEKRASANFMIKIGEKNETLAYDSDRHPERIALKQTVKIGDPHRELTKNMESKPWNDLILDIQDKALTYGVEYSIVPEKDAPRQINFVDMYVFIYIEDLTRDRFFHEFVRLEQSKDAIFNRISVRLGQTTQIEPSTERDRPGVT